LLGEFVFGQEAQTDLIVVGEAAQGALDGGGEAVAKPLPATDATPGSLLAELPPT
jgi:hypothetical protein